MPPGVAAERPSPLRDAIDFAHPQFALAVHMEDHRKGASCFYFSYDRGESWRGPFSLPLFGQQGVMGRTDYIVESRHTCLLFLTATKSDGTEGRPFCARTIDGGLTWQFLAFIGPEPRGYAVMPSTVRVSATDLVTTVRLRDFPRRWIDAYVSHDNGQSWSYLATPAPDIGQGNPPSLVRLADGRLCLTYGYRDPPYAIHARLSSDGGKAWTDPFVLRGNGGSQDIGYPRSVVRSDGRVVTAGSLRDIEATIWDPGTRSDRPVGSRKPPGPARSARRGQPRRTQSSQRS
jgi:BNR repeat-like domain